MIESDNYQVKDVSAEFGVAQLAKAVWLMDWAVGHALALPFGRDYSLLDGLADATPPRRRAAEPSTLEVLRDHRRSLT